MHWIEDTSFLDLLMENIKAWRRGRLGGVWGFVNLECFDAYLKYVQNIDSPMTETELGYL